MKLFDYNKMEGRIRTAAFFSNDYRPPSLFVTRQVATAAATVTSHFESNNRLINSKSSANTASKVKIKPKSSFQY
jgi:hypothetical protein